MVGANLDEDMSRMRSQRHLLPRCRHACIRNTNTA
jgi:hypothetical protein